ncbi:C-GCAxxG-C-C family protein [Halodesulfovibrio sp. MK-HDV]|uniref:C-GCAxxG-C-C family protein n=1 Tax=Halodesulfovibrio sp. MK-HDV TaxID=2599925 RepID=UPI0013698A40|nr:C-GCAxxG-C-C family protein [Halodesulfovibrio sp. MK-HDV]KAF1077569.1 hypothetical protein MKHDV_00025 [Halodesulfovibrio sp. MK-HDV]
MPKTRTEKAIAYLNDGLMCSEAVIAPYAEEFGLSKDVVLKISSGFAGGMAQALTCGAVSGAFMVIGLRHGAGVSKDQGSRNFCFQLVKEFSQRFEKRRGTIECRKILGMNDINPDNPEDMNRLRTTGICEGVVRDASDILEELLFENKVEGK